MPQVLGVDYQTLSPRPVLEIHLSRSSPAVPRRGHRSTPFMIDQRTHVVYRRLLLGPGHRYPLAQCPSELTSRMSLLGNQRRTEDGGFDFFLQHLSNGGRASL